MAVSRWHALLLAGLVTSAGRLSAQVSPPRPTDSLAWMAGCWELRSGRGVVEEQWLAPRGGVLLGVGRTTRGDTLVEFEFMRIYEAGDTLVFAAAPSGQRPAEFRAPTYRAGEVTFDNAAHDFPQRIRYRSAGADSLVARVEGERGGDIRGVDFSYRRTRCPASPRAP
jgi:Domain of unknown function (DUF6265)